MARHVRSLINLTAGIAALTLVGPIASAAATDLYVDNSGMGIPPCTNPASPCQFAQAIGTAVSGDEIHVGGGTYAGNVLLQNGVSLLKDSFASPFDTSGPAQIGVMANATPAITVAPGMAARTISGFTLRGGNVGASAAVIVADNTSNLTISGNTFDDNSANVFQKLRFNGGGTFQINGNSFVGENDGVVRRGIAYGADEGGSIEIGGNSMSDLFYPIQISGANPPATTVEIHDNQLRDVYDNGPAGAIPFGVDLSRVTGHIRDNLITQIPGQPSGGGFFTFTGSPATGTPLRVERNQVYGFAGYSQFTGGELLVFTDDVFANSGASATLALFDTTATATGITATGAASLGEIYLSTSNLTLDSSFVGPLGVGFTIGSTCTSTFSATTDPTPDCGLAGGANPLFANPAGNDFSLHQGSSLIDGGNPAAPAPGETDLLGAPRAIPVLSCTSRRDIGAYEFSPGKDCTPPDTTISGRRKVKTRRKAVRISFTFASTEAGASFACSLDGASFSPCISPLSAKVRRGAHRLLVRATDPDGVTDPTPASFTTKVKRKRLRR